MNNWKNKAKNHRWLRNPIQLQKTSIILIALAKIIWPDLRPITLLPHISAGNAPYACKPTSAKALRDRMRIILGRMFAQPRVRSHIC
jgi:hypothetical protein